MRILIILLLATPQLSAQTSGVIATISQSQRTPVPPEPPDPGGTTGIFVAKAVDGGNDANPCTFAQPCLTGQRGANVASTGDTVFFRAGTWRETIVPPINGISFWNYNDEEVFVSGVEDVGDAGWTNVSGNIWRKIITLPLNADYAVTSSGNTELFANQVFKDGYSMIQARWPNLDGNSADIEDLFNTAKYRNAQVTASTNTTTQLTDSGIPIVNLSGAQLIWSGWFFNHVCNITSSTSHTVNYSGANGNIAFRKRYYITGDLDLLDAENEYHYEGGFLYARQIGNGSPTGLTYKARRFGFDLSGRSGITIKGINFFACEVNGNTSTTNCTIDGLEMVGGNERSTAYYANHAYFIANENYNGGISLFTGMQLLGSGNKVKNMYFKYASGTSVWIGASGLVEDNKFEYIGYQGDYSAPLRPQQTADNVTVTKNSMYNLNRAGIDFNYSAGETHTNWLITLNDIGNISMITGDVACIYASMGTVTDGTVISYNWLHDNKADYNEGGIQCLGYQDQLSGWITWHHNAFWNGVVGNAFHERSPSGSPTNYYNNTMWQTGYASYVTHVPLGPVYDVIRNNYSAGSDVFCSGGCGNNKAYSLNGGTPLFVGGDLSVVKGLYFQLQNGSPLIDAGVSIPGVTAGVTGSGVDIGCYEKNISPWIPGPTW